MVCTGAKSEEDARTAARKYARIVKKLGFPAVKFKEFKIQNMVGSCDVKFPIRLEGLQYNNLFANYEPELFPGLVFRMLDPKIVLLIFVRYVGPVLMAAARWVWAGSLPCATRGVVCLCPGCAAAAAAAVGANTNSDPGALCSAILQWQGRPHRRKEPGANPQGV